MKSYNLDSRFEDFAAGLIEINEVSAVRKENEELIKIVVSLLKKYN